MAITYGSCCGKMSSKKSVLREMDTVSEQSSAQREKRKNRRVVSRQGRRGSCVPCCLLAAGILFKRGFGIFFALSEMNWDCTQHNNGGVLLERDRGQMSH